MTMQELTVENIGVQHDVNDDIVLVVRSNVLKHDEGIKLTVPLEEAIDLLRGLANAVTHSAIDAMIRVKSGDCATCGNTRLVDVEKNGYSTNDRCPDCGPKYEAANRAPFARPRIGGGIR